jgi:hypothetical protein
MFLDDPFVLHKFRTHRQFYWIFKEFRRANSWRKRDKIRHLIHTTFTFNFIRRLTGERDSLTRLQPLKDDLVFCVFFYARAFLRLFHQRPSHSSVPKGKATQLRRLRKRFCLSYSSKGLVRGLVDRTGWCQLGRPRIGGWAEEDPSEAEGGLWRQNPSTRWNVSR